MIRTLLPIRVEAELILAPAPVQRTFDRVNRFLGWACGVMGARPSERAISACFWRTFVEEGGDLESFEWLRSADLADELDRQEWLALI